MLRSEIAVFLGSCAKAEIRDPGSVEILGVRRCCPRPVLSLSGDRFGLRYKLRADSSAYRD